MAIIESFQGILPAMQVPFKPDLSIDEAELKEAIGEIEKLNSITTGKSRSNSNRCRRGKGSPPSYFWNQL